NCDSNDRRFITYNFYINYSHIKALMVSRKLSQQYISKLSIYRYFNRIINKRIDSRYVWQKKAFFNIFNSFNNCNFRLSIMHINNLINNIKRDFRNIRYNKKIQIINLFQIKKVGFFAPLGASMVTEITPDQYRAKVMCLVQFSVSIGQVLGLTIGYFTLKDLKDGNWRLLIIISGFPGLIAVAVALFFVDDSARFLMCSGQFENSFKILEKMNTDNGKQNFEEISEEKKEGLKLWSNKLSESLKNTHVNLQSLFKGDFGLITPIIWWNWFALSFTYYGILILLPTLLDKISSQTQQEEKIQFQSSEFDILKLILSSLTEMLACFLAAIMVDIKGLGRKNSVINFSIILFISLFMCYYDTTSRFIFWSSLSKFYILMITIFNFQYTCEAYFTKIRTTGLGIANGVGKFGGVLMPWICNQLSEIDLLSPFLLFAFITLIMAILTMQLPFDTLGREIDKIDDDKEKVE
ncbi:major facilitator superfamily protein, putative, partial [Ichthyophthirius multifiliis]